MKNTTKAVFVAIAIIAIIAVAIPSAAIKPVHGTNDTAPAMQTGVAGSVSGRITTSNSTIGLGNAFIAIVNASNHTQAFYVGQADANGNYEFVNVNNTINGSDGGNLRPLYQMYANDSVYGEGWSNPFGVNQYSTATANVVISPLPSKVVVTAERNNVVADSNDRVKVSAYVTDALGNPVGDNTPINFYVNNASNTVGWLPNVNGSLSLNGNYAPNQNVTNVSTVGGYANVSFGWVDEAYAGNNSSIIATYANDPSVNGSTSIYFNPTLASWFGSVQDSFGKPYGGVLVTLHLMGYHHDAGGNVTDTYEVYNMTTTSYVDLPYPGSYVFDNIELNSSVAYGYASADSGDIGDGVHYTGMSQNYTLNKSRTSSGFIVLHVPMPDGIKVTADPSTILVGGDTSTVTAQLYLNGKPYKRSGITVTFFGDNDTIGYLPAVRTNVSDTNGQASVILTSNQTKGDVNVTGYAKISMSRNLSDKAIVHVVGWGTISGMVTDKNKNGIPNAKVELWNANYANGTWEKQSLVKSPENPQYTVSRPEIAAIGTYTYYRIPAGIYNVTATVNDSVGNQHIWFAIVNLTEGTATNNIALPDYVTQVATATATASATTGTEPSGAASTASPSGGAKASPTASPGFETVFALAGLLGVAYLITRKEH
ncbi:MAG TPA: PGF-CTERM sorting domain-containing protein [Methanocella sp.]|nr:PGF-CTERM sorting domain-containing protein [Methanocella sp.]